MARFILPLLTFALGAVAQSVAYTDPNTNIDFMSYYDSDTETRWGVATPETLGKDLIIQMVAPTTVGWAGFDLGTAMSNKLLVVAWPNGDEVMSSFRLATGYTSPGVYSGNVTASPIANGTFVNSTHFSYTFVCGGCVTGDSDSFSTSLSGTAFGWAYSEDAPTTPSSASTALKYHSKGYGAFSVIFANSSSSNFDTWASWAEASTTSSSSSSNSTSGSSFSNSTTHGSANITALVSNTTYDYIIAGAGPAGIIVAERLSESGAEVLLIERGGPSTSSTGCDELSWNDTTTQYDVPAISQYLTSGVNDTSEWCTDTADQAGCILGGGSAINALNFVRPQERDFDDKWPTGWKWSDVSSAADKLYERNPGTINPSMDGKHYDQGVYNIVSKFFASNGWTSVNAIEEPNKKHNVYSYPPWSIVNGERAGPVKTYLPLAQARDNFHLQMHTSVVRAVRSGSTISGVEVELSSSARQIINVNKGGKVILAGGVYSTPRILINSGIGPDDQIKIVQDGNVQVTLPEESDWINLPVGKNVMDHPKLPILFKSKTSLSALSEDDILEPSQDDISLWAQGSGVLTHSSQRLAFYSSVEGSDGQTRFIEGTCTAPSNDTVKIQVYLTHGLTSTGSVGVTADGATEYLTQPWLNTQADKDALTTFLDRLLEYTRAANSTLTLDTSQAGITANSTGADLLTNVVTGNHYVGSARLGTDDGRVNNGSAVVDLDTKVYGTDNLFVVDASIHPDLPTGNTQAIIMVVAEAAAARILNAGSTNSTSRYAVSSGSVSASASIPTQAAQSSAPYANTTVTSAPTTVQTQLYSTASSSFDSAAFSSAIGNLTSGLPTAVLSSTLSSGYPSATAVSGGGNNGTVPLPRKPLPADLTLADLLGWIDFIVSERMEHGTKMY